MEGVDSEGVASGGGSVTTSLGVGCVSAGGAREVLEEMDVVEAAGAVPSLSSGIEASFVSRIAIVISNN